MDLLANIRLGWKGLTGTNAQAYFVSLLATKEKRFTTLITGPSARVHFIPLPAISQNASLAGKLHHPSFEICRTFFPRPRRTQLYIPHDRPAAERSSAGGRRKKFESRTF